MRFPLALLALPLALGLAVPPALAQTTLPPGQVRAKALMDRDVYSSDNVEIGEIEDLLIDAEGRVVSAVIEIESRLGFTAKYIILPYNQLRLEERRVTLAIPQEQVRGLPSFDYRK